MMRGYPSRQRGAAAVEFAFVFPVLFFLLYGGISYGFIFVLKQSLNFAAQEAAQAAVAVNPLNLSSGTTTAYTAAVQSKASSVVSGSGGLLTWMPATLLSHVSVTATVASATGTGAATPYSLTVTVQLANVSTGCGGTGGFLTTICLPFVGAAPPLPTSLSATAIVGI